MDKRDVYRNKERRSFVSELVNQRARRVLSPDEGETVWLRKLGIRFIDRRRGDPG